MKSRFGYPLLFLALVLSSSCGKEERVEAVRFHKVLSGSSVSFAQANAGEKDFVTGVKAWSESIVANGSGRGEQLERESAAAAELAGTASSISTQIGQVRQAVYDLPIHEEFAQGIRSTLVGNITKRQRYLQELKAALEETSVGFKALAGDRSYKGDSYPQAIEKLNGIVGRYSPADDAVAEAVNALRAKYAIKPADAGTT